VKTMLGASVETKLRGQWGNWTFGLVWKLGLQATVEIELTR